MSIRTCSIDTCSREHEGHGLCNMHLARQRRNGDPLVIKLKSRRPESFVRILNDDMARFKSFVDPQPQPNGCIYWLGTVAETGHGQFWAGRLHKAHRWIYEQVNGSLERGIDVDHVCHNVSNCNEGNDCLHRRCVNLEHLEAVTHRVNSQRGRTGSHNAAKTHCIHGHEFTEANTIIRKGGYRGCRACKRISETLRTREVTNNRGGDPKKEES